MSTRNGFFRVVGISIIAAIILSACSAAPTATASAVVVASPTVPDQSGSSTEIPTNIPASTPTPAVSPTATETSTLVVTATEAFTQIAQGVAQVIPTLNAYCRKGPGSGYDAPTFLQKGTAYNVIGRDNLKSWWQIQAPGNFNCWVVDTIVNRQGPVEQAPIVQAPPLPGTPAQFVNSYSCVSKKSLTVSFTWEPANYANGYRIFRNGTKVMEVGPTVTSYSEDAPMNVNLIYEMEAFNDYGVSLHASNSVPACN
jgi:hypothetical protein